MEKQFGCQQNLTNDAILVVTDMIQWKSGSKCIAVFQIWQKFLTP